MTFALDLLRAMLTREYLFQLLLHPTAWRIYLICGLSAYLVTGLKLSNLFFIPLAPTVFYITLYRLGVGTDNPWLLHKLSYCRWPLVIAFTFFLQPMAAWFHEKGVQLPFITHGWPTVFLLQSAIAHYIIRHTLCENRVTFTCADMENGHRLPHINVLKLVYLSLSYAIQACFSAAFQLVALRLLCLLFERDGGFLAMKEWQRAGSCLTPSSTPWPLVWAVLAPIVFLLNVVPLLLRDIITLVAIRSLLRYAPTFREHMRRQDKKIGRSTSHGLRNEDEPEVESRDDMDEEMEIPLWKLRFYINTKETAKRNPEA